MSPTMSNTQQGQFSVNSGEDLTGKEGYLVELATSSGKTTATLPNADADLALFLVEDGGASGEQSVVRPILGTAQVRVKAKGTGNAGDRLVNAAVSTAADKGKLRALPGTAGDYRVVAIALESFVDGQLVKVAPASLGIITVS